MTTTSEREWVSHARGLADLLRDRGDIRSPEWYAAVAQVPRHVFVPRAYSQAADCTWQAWDTAGRWDRVYAPETLVTALDDEAVGAVSSSTKPDLMVRMLETLDVHDGHRVLEIGLGTGYNAALLCHRLDEGHVFSIDVDPGLVELARQRLATAGYRPTVAAVDGAGGLPEHAPYDRIIATCSVPAVPWTWADQLAPGGSILVDYKLATSAGNLVHLHRTGDLLQGRFTPRFAAFMAMRRLGEQPPPVHTSQAGASGNRPTRAPVQPWREPVVWFLAHLCGLPHDVTFGIDRAPASSFLTAPDGSWVRVDHTEHTVTEGGQTPLWELVEHAHRLWESLGRPGWDRLGLTVEPGGRHTVWLDQPGHGIQP